MFFNGKVGYLMSTQKSNFLVSEGRNMHKHASTEGGCNEGLAKQLQLGYSGIGVVQVLQTFGSESLQRIFMY